MAFSALIEAEIDRIAAQLLASARRDAHGLYWLTSTHQPAPSPAENIDESVFSGTTGIVLFFVALHQHSGDANHRRVAEDGTRWIVEYARTHAPQYVSFFSGRTGVVYLCCKLYELTQEPTYLQQARQLAEAIYPELRAGNGLLDLVGGEAGNLFVVAYLYQLTGAECWLPVLDAGLRRLVDQALISRQGLKWGYQPHSLDGLCGLSHGASGVGYVLLELGRYFASEALCWLADQAFHYEAQYYRKSLGNWLDLRTYRESVGDPATLHQPATTLLIKGGNANSWAYGATGIGLVRLRALEIAPQERYRQEVRWAVAKTLRDLARKDLQPDYSLSHGIGGQAELLLGAASLLPTAALPEQVRQLARRAVEVRQRLGYFPGKAGRGQAGLGLLPGVAGIGYFLLRALSPARVEPLLLPRLPPATSHPAHQAEHYFWNQSLVALRETVWGRHLHRTLFLVRKIAPQMLAGLFDKPDDLQANTSEPQAVQSQLQASIRELPDAVRGVVSEVFRLERSRAALLLSRQPIVYQATKKLVDEAQARLLADVPPDEFRGLRFIICRHVRILPNRWSWKPEQVGVWADNLTAPAKDFPTLLVHNAYVVEEYSLKPLPALLLQRLRRPALVAELIHKISALVAPQDQPELLAALPDKIIAQIKQLLAEGLIEQRVIKNNW